MVARSSNSQIPSMNPTLINMPQPTDSPFDDDRYGGGPAIAAVLSTALAGANNDLDYLARLAGVAGNNITIQYLDPAANSQALSVTVSGRAIVVHLATNGSGVITSTAALVKAAIDAAPSASVLVAVANKSGNDGTGVVTAMAATPLAGGAKGRSSELYVKGAKGLGPARGARVGVASEKIVEAYGAVVPIGTGYGA